MSIKSATFQSGGRVSQHYIPGAYSRIDYLQGAGGLVSLSNAAILGRSEGGEPNKLYWFGSPTQAESVLRGGPLLDAVKAAFNPGGGIVPQQIAAMRVNTATQSTYDLVSGGTTLVSLTSWDYGLHTVQIRLKLEDGSTNGKKLTVAYKNEDPIVEDNIYKPSFDITYGGGSSSATMTITKTGITTTLDSGTDIDIDFASFDTMEELVNFLNDKPDYTCNLLTDDGSDKPEHLDTVSTQDITSTYVATSNLQALIETAEEIPWIASAEFNDASSDRAFPDNVASWDYFSGGTDGSFTSSDWENSFSELEEEDVQLVGAATADEAIHMLVVEHCNVMNSITGKNERQAILGGAAGENVDAVTARAQNLNSSYASLCYPEYQEYNDAGQLEWFPPYYYAAKMIGMATVLNLPEPHTNNDVAALQFKTLTRTQIAQLIKAGVWVGAKSRDGRQITIRSVTTAQAPQNLIEFEFSMMRVALAVNRDLRTSIERAYTGRAMTGSLLSDIDVTASTRLNTYVELGWFLGTGEVPAYSGYKRTVSGSSVTIEYEANVTPPANFIFITSKLGVVANI